MDPTFQVFSTADWGARTVTRNFEANRAEGIIVHHTAGENRAPETGNAERDTSFRLARSIQASHMDGNGWADTGQNFLVSRGGLVLEGRTSSLLKARQGFVARGAHAGTDDGNRFWFGIEVEGNNVDEFLVTEPQWRSLVELCAWLSASGETQTQNIRGHKQFANTKCPGLLIDRLPELIAQVRRRKLELLGQA